tara:strand:- start:1039 stop:3804 length:2766 start_codon:yes stop_codon:yes gene_type:complete
MFTLEELFNLRQSGEQAKNQGLTYNPNEDPNPFMYTEREPMVFEMEEEVVETFADGDQPAFLPPGSSLPTNMFGERQAAEKESPKKNYTRYDPKRHKLKLPEVREGIASITSRGMKEGLKQTDIMRKINLFVGAAGYTENEINPRAVTDNVIRTNSYNPERPNPFPWTKLGMSFAGSVGGTIGGARLGAMAGSVAGPAGTIVGGILGGTVGYLSGLLGYEGLLNNLNDKGMLYTPTYNEIGEFMGMKQGIDRPDVAETMDYLKEEAKRDLIWGTAFGMFRPGVALLKGFGRNVLGGVGKNELKRAEEIQSLTGITPGTTDISRYGFVRAMPGAITKLPFLGGGFKRGFDEKRRTFIKEADKLFNFGPSINAAELGHDLSKVRQAVTSDIIQNISSKYKQYFDAIGNAPVFDWSNARNIAGEAYARYGKLLDEGQKMASPAFKKLEILANKGPGKMSGEEWLYHRQTLNEILFGPRMKENYGPMMDDLYAVSRELETAFGKMTKLNPGVYNQAFESLKEADKAFSDMTVLFGSTAMKKLGMDEKFAYNALAKIPGSIESDQLFSRVFNDWQSPEAVQKLYDFIGPEVFAKGMKGKLLDAFESSFTQSKGSPGFQDVSVDYFKSFDDLTFNAEVFKKRLGITGAGKKMTGGAPFAAFDKGMALAREGADNLPDAKKLVAFADAAEIFFNAKNMNISQFLTRKTTLGGFRGFINSIVPTLAVSGGAASVGGAIPSMGTLAGIIMARKLGYVMSSPVTIDLWGKAMKGSAGSAKQGRLFAEGLQALLQQYPDLPSELENEFNNIQNRSNDNPTIMELYEKESKKITDLSAEDFIESLKGKYGDSNTFIAPGMRTDNIPVTPEIKPQVDPNAVPQINPGSINTTPVQPNNTGGLNVMNKVNQNSRLALAGNDPLMQGIAMNNRRAI